MKITVIGAGAMGGSTVEGMLHGNVSLPSDITVADLSQERLSYFAENLGRMFQKNGQPTPPALPDGTKDIENG